MYCPDFEKIGNSMPMNLELLLKIETNYKLDLIDK